MTAADTSYMKEKPVLSAAEYGYPYDAFHAHQFLYNIVDGIFVARMSEDAMMAISLVYPVQNLLHSIAVGFGVGTNAVIAIFLGSRKSDAASSAASQEFSESLPRSTVHGFRHSLYAAIPEYVLLPTKQSSLMVCSMVLSSFAFSDPHNRTVFLKRSFQSVGRMKTSMINLGCGSSQYYPRPAADLRHWPIS